MKLINLTPHDVTIYDLDGDKHVFPSEGVARSDSDDAPLMPLGKIPVVSAPVWGPVYGLPDPAPGVAYIVSSVLRDHPAVVGRADVFSPATGPKHAALRDEKGHIKGVTRLVSAQKA